MPSTAKSGRTANEVDSAFANALGTQQEAIESFMEMSQAIFKGLVEYNKELTNFVAGRVVKDLDLQKRLFECNSIDDVVALQGGFVETAVDQYSAEAQKLASIGADVTKQDLEAIGRHIKPSSGPAKSA